MLVGRVQTRWNDVRAHGGRFRCSSAGADVFVNAMTPNAEAAGVLGLVCNSQHVVERDQWLGIHGSETQLGVRPRTCVRDTWLSGAGMARSHRHHNHHTREEGTREIVTTASQTTRAVAVSAVLPALVVVCGRRFLQGLLPWARIGLKTARRRTRRCW